MDHHKSPLAPEVWNLYGPTETTIWSTAEPVRDTEISLTSGPILIGRPIANTRAYVLGEPHVHVPPPAILSGRRGPGHAVPLPLSPFEDGDDLPALEI